MGLLDNKNAVVTGAGSGIGKAIALALAEQGANVSVCDINIQTVSETRNEIAAKGVSSEAFMLDISKIEEHGAAVDRIEREFGQIDIIVNNAGISFNLPVWEVTPEIWERVTGINLRGTFFLAQAVFNKMRERKKGRIINIGSVAGDRPADTSDAAYSISKAGILMISKVFAKAARDTEITVNSVSPGIVDTPLTARLGSVVNSDKIPLGRMGKPDEIADAVVFLASDMASYINGQNIRVNGGQYML